MAEAIALIAATGNRFALVDGFRSGPLDDPGALAVAVGERDGLAVDGLLQLLAAPDDDTHCTMLVHNVDGSRAEACGNGLRCIARVAAERDYVPSPRFRVATDAGPRAVEILASDGGTARVRVEMGTARIVEAAATVGVREGRIEVAVLDLGNPHAVLFVPDVATAPVASIGEQLEHHALFPDRTNVEFVDARAGELRLRIWERGVGETASCGSGACAAAVAAIESGRASSPLRVVTRGGVLVVTWDGKQATLEGDVDAIERELDFRV